MDKIYLVKGYTGEYDDTYEWIAKAFKDPNVAKKYHKKLLKIIQEHHEASKKEVNDFDFISDLEKKLNLHDPKCRVDYTGVTYEIQEVQIND